VALRGISLLPGSYQTLFLLFDRPAHGRIGETFDIEVMQLHGKTREVIGGLDIRIALTPEVKKSAGMQPHLARTPKKWSWFWLRSLEARQI
jgi:hypothetical protein